MRGQAVLGERMMSAITASVVALRVGPHPILPDPTVFPSETITSTSCGDNVNLISLVRQISTNCFPGIEMNNNNNFVLLLDGAELMTGNYIYE
jgi:hypothetical protein